MFKKMIRRMLSLCRIFHTPRPTKNRKNTFRIVYLDDDMKTFSLSLPTVDDTSVNDATVELLKQGRNVRITTVDSRADIKEIKQYYQRLGFRFDSKTIW